MAHRQAGEDKGSHIQSLVTKGHQASLRTGLQKKLGPWYRVNDRHGRTTLRTCFFPSKRGHSSVRYHERKMGRPIPIILTLNFFHIYIFKTRQNFYLLVHSPKYPQEPRQECRTSIWISHLDNKDPDTGAIHTASQDMHWQEAGTQKRARTQTRHHWWCLTHYTKHPQHYFE